MFQFNHDSCGRVLRASLAIDYEVTRRMVAAVSRHRAIGLLVCVTLLAIESGRGWCLLRACEFRTPLS
jgi:hypothetical protein